MNVFRNVLSARPKLNKFDLSYEHKLSFNFGEIIPTFIQEIVPGDRLKMSAELMLRMAPTLAPLFHRVNIFTHYWFVPNRIIFNEWNDFMTGGKDGTTDVAPPTIGVNDSHKTRFAKGRLPDYFGFPVIEQTDTVAQNVAINALPFRAYQEIYNEFYRDQNLEDPIEFSKDPGAHSTPDVEQLTLVRQRAYEKDYFTSALPWPQRGADVNLPSNIEYGMSPEFTEEDGTPIANANLETNPAGIVIGNPAAASGKLTGIIESLGITINDLRNSVRLQEWLEANARGGARLTEVILQHFNIKSKDSRLQRPEFLGGGRQPITMSEVLQTAPTGSDIHTNDTPLGTMAGHGISVGQTNRFKRKFTEHGFVIGVTSVLPRTAYQQGIDKMFLRPDKLAYYWPKFANLGEQPLLNGEVYYDWLDGTTDAEGNKQSAQTFGYQSRYAEYKYNRSKVSGDFRDELSYWHLGRIFESMPALNNQFIKAESEDMDRIFAVTDPVEQKLYAQVYNNVQALRPMPYFGTPRL